MIKICKKHSSKSDKDYYVLVVNGVYVSFDVAIIEKVAMTNEVSNIDLKYMQVGEEIYIKEV